VGITDVEQLQTADSRLTRSFIGCVAVFAASILWTLFVAPAQAGDAGQPSVWIPLLLFVLQIAFYVWYAIAAGGAAKVLGATKWHYVVWILLAPFLALLPIPVVSTIIGVSPLSIKFLLGGQLQTAMRQAAFDQLH